MGVLLTIAGAVFPPAAAAGSFQSVGSMAEARYDPVVVTLADGSALVIGGWKQQEGREVGIATAERFDPKTDQFEPVGSMAEPHLGHAALRLPDGRVLVVGGATGFMTGSPVLHAELFDPATGSFSRAGKLAGIRSDPTLSLLPEGRVLVAGGWTDDPTAPSAEIFDPATGEFEPGPAMVAHRYQHSAVTLPDGRVVLLGGYTMPGAAVKQVEIYDPKTNAFHAAGNLVQGRGNTTAGLLPDGRVLIAAGVGGDSNGYFLRNTLEIYDPATAQSTVAARLPTGQTGHNLVPLRDGRFLLAGGFRAPGGSQEENLTPARLFLPATGEITPAGPMGRPRHSAGATLLGDGRALVVGGFGFQTGSRQPVPLAEAEVYLP